LRNVIERAVIVSSGPLLTVADLCPSAPSHPSSKHDSATALSALPVGKALKDVERELILQTLGRVGGNRLRAAEILGISPKTLYNKLGRYQSEGETFQARSAIGPQR
jgi:two-component system response regulator FlrC